ncbi:MAG TPA: hypothetical protein VFY22_04755 [Hydrogenophaga sp.]|nr:hypothetical protein [Hydrogenophaga sp.]
MGIRFKSNTWRTPLRLIDNLLPLRSTTQAATPRKPSRALQLFARAGWLNRGSEARERPATTVAAATGALQGCGVRVLRSSSIGVGGRRDMRMVISGRIGDVCAELDRMAAQEQSALMRQI